MIPTCGTGAKTMMTFVPGATRCVFFLLASSWWHLCFCWSSPPCSRLRNDKSSQRAPDRKRDDDSCRLPLPSLEDQRSSLPFATQITKWASRTASRVACDTPGSASAAALALSPACSSSMTATRSSSDAAALSAFLANSLTTATSTGEAPSSLTTASRALSILTRAASSRSAIVVTGEAYARPARDVPDRRPDDGDEVPLSASSGPGPCPDGGPGWLERTTRSGYRPYRPCSGKVLRPPWRVVLEGGTQFWNESRGLECRRLMR